MGKFSRHFGIFFLFIFLLFGISSCANNQSAVQDTDNDSSSKIPTLNLNWYSETPSDTSNEEIKYQANETQPIYSTLPSQYMVRSWDDFKDCLWNIAGQSWAYNDPAKWVILYNANKAKLPDPDNPDLLVPGMILDIPSLNGEARQGLWNNSNITPALNEARIAGSTTQINPPSVNAGTQLLPSQYIVRSWDISKDCFWNIAAQPWVYNDPRKWIVLYSANKSRLPDPDNPDLLPPGLILNIPSINSETREGMWLEERNYTPLRI